MAAARQGTGSGLLAKVVRAYRRRPDAAEVEIVFTRDQADLVRNGTADIALMCRRAPVDGLESSEVAEVQTVALLPLEHSFAAKPAVSVADVVQDELFRPLWPEDAAEIVLDEIIEKAAVGELAVTVGRVRLTGSDPPRRGCSRRRCATDTRGADLAAGCPGRDA
ncbi:LysR substrate-binding domain-containing protein [Streptomyces sp. NBC_01518]|uniref:LysR substrate-binding domain-containing protein n=1 Tax=Streptomyces sp. NBC_01518 TaxID=2903891 RepID=UPI0038647185